MIKYETFAVIYSLSTIHICHCMYHFQTVCDMEQDLLLCAFNLLSRSRKYFPVNSLSVVLCVYINQLYLT